MTKDSNRGSSLSPALAGGAALAVIGLGLVVTAPSDARAQAGSYQQTCRNSTNSAGRLFSECRMPDGRYRRSSIETAQCHGEISNQNGILACKGAVAQDGGVVAAASGGRNDRNSASGKDDRRGDDRNRGGGYGGNARDDRGGYGQGDYGQGGYGQGGYGQGGGCGQGDRGEYGGGYAGGRRPDLVLFEGVNFTGRSLEVNGDISDLKRSGFNDRAHSAKVYSGRWKLCRDADYRRCEHVGNDVPDLNRLGAGGSISSVERE